MGEKKIGKTGTDNSIVEVIYYIGITLLIFFASNLLISVTGLIVGIPIGWYNLPLAFVVAIGVVLFLAGKNKWKSVLVAACISIVVAVLAGFLSSLAFSAGYDCNYYHKMAIGLLGNGWNPFVESSQIFFDAHVREDQQGILFDPQYIDSYPKATWALGASFYSLFGGIEWGKAYNLIGSVALFGIALPYFREKLNKRIIPAVIVSAVLALSPIAIYQMFEYYLDGVLASIFFILIIGLTQMVDRDYSGRNKWMWVTIGVAMVLLGNIKYTGLAFGAIFCMVFYVIAAIQDIRRHAVKPAVMKFVFFVVIAAVTVCWAGAPSYLMNFINHGNPLYPMQFSAVSDEGATAVSPGSSVMSIAIPLGFRDQPSWYSLFYSLFGEFHELIEYEVLPQLKFPFSMTSSELEALQGPIYAPKISGFGVLFSGILILSLIVIISGCFLLRKKQKSLVIYSIIMLVVIWVLMLAMQESWWARYMPFFYLIPVLGLFMAFKLCNLYGKIMSIFLSVALIVNNTFFFLSVGYEFASSVEINRDLKELSGDHIILHNYKDREGYEFYGLVFNLDEFDIDWSLGEPLNGANEAMSSTFYGQLRYGIPFRDFG